MPRITLNYLKIENFKGVKSFEMELNGDNKVITAENGIGKTTIYDGFLWLLFGKDSTGRKDFEVRPLDRRNNPIKGVVLAVEAEINVDGVLHEFRKEHHEKVVKKQLRGYETLCWIDEVPYKVGEYTEYIEKIISEERFKLLTDLHFFNSKMHWKERRKVLMEIAGEIGEPEGFEELTATMKGRPIDKFKTVLTDRKKAYDKERAEINPRIDELLRGLEHPAEDTTELALRRDIFKRVIKKLEVQRKELNAQEARRQNIILKVFTLKERKVIREAELKGSLSGVQKLLDDKAQIAKDVARAEQLVDTGGNEMDANLSKTKAKESEREALLKSLERIRSDLEAIESQKITGLCYACNQKLPAAKIEDIKKKRQEVVADNKEGGKETQNKINAITKLIEALESNRKLLIETCRGAEVALKQTREKAEARLLEIEVEIKERPTILPGEDEAWNKIVNEGAKLTDELGEPIEDQLTAIETERESAQKELDGINETLAQADRIEKDKARIKELEAKEKELAQSIADVEKILSAIEQYKAEQSTMITNVVNKLFEVVEFKMFRELLNGGLEECCEAVLNGVPYSDMSTGEGIYVGVDINNVLSGHYDYSVPLFIDHAESLSLPINPKSQTIKLFMKKGVKELQIETKSKSRKVVV